MTIGAFAISFGFSLSIFFNTLLLHLTTSPKNLQRHSSLVHYKSRKKTHPTHPNEKSGRSTPALHHLYRDGPSSKIERFYERGLAMPLEKINPKASYIASRILRNTISPPGYAESRSIRKDGRIDRHGLIRYWSCSGCGSLPSSIEFNIAGV